VASKLIAFARRRFGLRARRVVSFFFPLKSGFPSLGTEARVLFFDISYWPIFVGEAFFFLSVIGMLLEIVDRFEVSPRLAQ